MKTQYRIYKNRIKKSFNERYHIKKKVWGKKWEAFVKKGHEKMSVLWKEGQKKSFMGKTMDFMVGHQIEGSKTN